MQNIDWNKLQPYSGDNKKSFEELCYQIVSEKYQDEIERGAKLTSIDDSGGGDGVEFYITFENGDVYGWQAKFFCRLNEGGRKEQIKKSLKTAYEKHPTLKKWYLCNKCNFTTDEQEWFDDSLESSIKDGERVLPEGHCVELIHWGESEFLDFLQKYPSIYNFFFSDKFLTYDWFKEKYDIYIQKKEIKAKYEATLHTPTHVDLSIKKLLGGINLIKVLEEEIELRQVIMYAKEYHDAYLQVYSQDIQSEYQTIQKEFRKFLQDKENIIQYGIDILLSIKDTLINNDEKELKNRIEALKLHLQTLYKFLEEYDNLSNSELCNDIEHISVNHNDEVSKEEQKKINLESSKRTKARNLLNAPRYTLHDNTISSLESCFRVFELLEQNELHISGKAGMGKTHISFNIYEDYIIHQSKPALFIQAKDLFGEQSLESQLKNVLGISDSLSFDDFLSALEVTARVERIKIPIIIDGLNESMHWGLLWKNGLENLILKIKKYLHIAIITTYRTSYEDQLFPDGYCDYKTNDNWWKLKITLRGFEGVTKEAIKKYFDFYKLKLTSHSDAMEYFEHPLHLKLFCVTKNPRRQNEVKVSFQNENLFEVFDEYILNSNKNITTALKSLDPKYDENFTTNKLLELSRHLWESNSRGISRSNELLSNEELRIFESENLLIYRDWNREANNEEIQFIYDLLGGYFIAQYLIKTYAEFYPYIKYNSNNKFVNFIKTGFEFFIPERGTELLENGLTSINKKIGKKKPLLKFVKSKEFKKQLLDNRTKHPLYDDILRTVSILLIKKDNIFLFDILGNERVKQYSMESLFEINPSYVESNEEIVKQFLESEFKNYTTKLLNLSINTELDIGHPLNFNFWSDLLKHLSMTERDKLWSEYIRYNHSWYGHSYFSNFVENFEKSCIQQKDISDKVHIGSKKIMWILTTNIRKLRDKATRALYFYARRSPKEFLDILKYSLDINDIYVLERMLAVTYGLAMARQNDFKDKSYKEIYLPLYGKLLFENFFSESAKFPISHILARDYAKRTIDIALLHYPDLLTSSEKELIKYPLQSYPHNEWGESIDTNDSEYRDGNSPIHMDFKNYTIGRLIKDRSNYDSEHNEYQQVLSQIYWRIYNLGYSLEKFGEIDKRIASENWDYSRDDNASKIDRYGKKYSWVAFYEMAGYRSDLGLLKRWEDEDEFRISDVDIDPSFPTELKQYNLFKEMINNNFLGDEQASPESWYGVDIDLDIKEYISLNNNFDNDEKSDWILLKGSISQKNKDNQTRDVYISINAVLVDEDDFEKINSITDKYDDYAFEYIRNNEDYYLFEGEIPWCDLMQKDYSQTFTLSYNYHDVNKARKDLKIFNNDIELTDEELALLKKKESDYLYKSSKDSSRNILEVDFTLLAKGKDELTKKIAEDMGYTLKYIDNEYSEVDNDYIQLDMETTIFESSWESHHSETNPSGSTKVPSKKISNGSEVFLKPQSSDLYNKDGEIISTTFKYGEGYDNTSSFTYLRKDYLEKYLKDTNKKILWLQWSEKRYFPNGIKKLDYGEGKTEYRTYYKIIL